MCTQGSLRDVDLVVLDCIIDRRQGCIPDLIVFQPANLVNNQSTAITLNRVSQATIYALEHSERGVGLERLGHRRRASAFDTIVGQASVARDRPRAS